MQKHVGLNPAWFEPGTDGEPLFAKEYMDAQSGLSCGHRISAAFCALIAQDAAQEPPALQVGDVDKDAEIAQLTAERDDARAEVERLTTRLQERTCERDEFKAQAMEHKFQRDALQARIDGGGRLYLPVVNHGHERDDSQRRPGLPGAWRNEMSKILIDHEAAKVYAEQAVAMINEGDAYPDEFHKLCADCFQFVAPAYLDMVAQRDAERARVESLTVALSNAIGLLDGCILDCSQEDIDRLTAVMEGRDNG